MHASVEDFVIFESSFVQNYESDVLDWLEMNGFNETANSPIEVYQEDDCLYIEPRFPSRT